MRSRFRFRRSLVGSAAAFPRRPAGQPPQTRPARFDVLHRQRPDRRRHRRAMVPRRRRHHRRPHRRPRRARRATAATTIDATNLVVSPRLHRPARPVGVQRPGRRPRREQDSPGHHDRGDRRRVVDRAGQRPHDPGGVGERRATSASRRTGGRWPTTSGGIEERSRTTINVATFVGAGGIRNYVIGKDDRPATAAELEQMKQLVAQAMEQGALGRQHLAAVRAGSVRVDRRDRRAGEGGRALRRRLLHASAIRERPHLRIARRGVRDCRAGEHSRRDLAPQDRVQGELRQDGRRCCGASKRRARAAST